MELSATPLAGCGVHHAIEEQAHSRPYAKALVHNQHSLTYGELNRRANQFAHYLRMQGISNGTRVAICLERSFEAVISVLAILKTGAAYVPISHTHSIPHLSRIIQLAQPQLIITNNQLAADLGGLPCPCLLQEDIEETMRCYPDADVNDVNVTADQMAYVIFTSGTTGEPKGVMVTHQNLMATYASWQQVYRLGTEVRSHLQMASFGFDVFTGDLIRALCSGGSLVFCPDSIRTNPAELYQLLVRESVDCVEFVPAILRSLTEYAISTSHRLDFMKLIICGSDSWTMSEFKLVKSICSSQTRLINTYGLTEASIDSTYFEPTSQQLGMLPNTLTVPLGKPFPHVELHLLDDQLRPVAQGKIGTIFIGGQGVSQGYYQRDDLTKQRFLRHSTVSESRLYNTGDLGMALENGLIAFVGRADCQVKLNGQRIELNAIESVMKAYPGIEECVVILKEFGPTVKRLQAFVISQQGQLNYNTLKQHAANHLPAYSIPHEFYRLDCCYLTTNGKIDRLATVRSPAIQLQPDSLPPRTPLEKELITQWEKLLQCSGVGVNQAFNELGGNSLLLAELLHGINQQYSLNLQPCEITGNVTVEQLATQI